MASKEVEVPSLEVEFARQNARLAQSMANDQAELARAQTRFTERQTARTIALETARNKIESYKGASPEQEGSLASEAHSALSALSSVS